MHFKILFATTFISAMLICCAQPEKQASKPEPTQQENQTTTTTTGKQHKYTNKLIHEQSPYLKQHAHNPVDWYPWGEEAFKKAKAKNKPIFLSIGYATCHWCHVMEKETFEDEEMAKYLNKHFVCIKVDREERPDIDAIYMQAVRRYNELAGKPDQAGWPLSAFLTSDKELFFGGTYYSLKHFNDLANRIVSAWEAQQENLVADSKKVTEIIKRSLITSSNQTVTLSTAILDEIDQAFVSTHDKQHGGQLATGNNHNKFPSPHHLSFMLRQAQRNGKAETLNFVTHTLEAMAKGGIHDHLGGGFHRYSTDVKWLLPHFEKMLYDQALLAIAYVEAYQFTRNELFADTAKGIFNYVLRKMTHSQGGFYCAEDADSEGVEGKFYLWSHKKIMELLGPKRGKHFCALYEIQAKGNFHAPSNKNSQENIIHIRKNISDVAKQFSMPLNDFKAEINASKKILFDHRFKRIHPLKDDKILTAWNGLMISAMAKGARVFNDKKLCEAAEKAANFILGQLQNKEGRLLRRFCEGHAAILGYLDDYAYFVNGLIDLYYCNFDPTWLREATRLNEDMMSLFESATGGLYFSGKDSEKLLARRKDSYDGARPSGNSYAALNCLRLGHIKKDDKLNKQAEAILKDFSMALRHAGTGHTQLAIALDYYLGPRQEIVLVGELDDLDSKEMIKEVNKFFLPRCTIMLRFKNRPFAILEQLPHLKDHKSLEGKATAYLCQNYVCQLPVNKTSKLNTLLKQIKTSK